MKRKCLSWALVGLLAVLTLSHTVNSQLRSRRGAVCFNPNVACRTTATFESHDIPFRIPANAVIWESEMFYAVVLNSVRYRDRDCTTTFIPESQRLEAQTLFPDRKVFASRCGEPGNLFYTNISHNTNFMAVYAGKTRAEAARVLASVRAMGKYPGANIRRMYAGFNGT